MSIAHTNISILENAVLWQPSCKNTCIFANTGYLLQVWYNNRVHVVIYFPYPSLTQKNIRQLMFDFLMHSHICDRACGNLPYVSRQNRFLGIGLDSTNGKFLAK